MAFSFITKRWKSDPRTHALLLELAEFDDAPKPSLDSPHHFMNVPTEIRLQVYRYLDTSNENPSSDSRQSQFDVRLASSTSYAYLYRSPGRCTKPNALSRTMLDMLHVCHQLREELLDSFFSDRIFVLEASLYSRDFGGLCVLPSHLGPMAFLRRLLILTVLRLEGPVSGIADLRPLQQMTRLKELQIVFCLQRRGQSTHTPSIFDVPDNPIRAVLECVPENAVIHVGPTPAFQMELSSFLGSGANYLFSGDEVDTVNVSKALHEHMDVLSKTKGRLSGSLVNHAECQYQKCLEDLGCVNSQLPTHPESSANALSQNRPNYGGNSTRKGFTLIRDSTKRLKFWLKFEPSVRLLMLNKMWK